MPDICPSSNNRPMITIKDLSKNIGITDRTTQSMNMNTLIFITVLFGAACAGGLDKDAPIESQHTDIDLDGIFHNTWAGNGISVQEVGSSKVVDKELAQVIQGVVEYTAPDGTHIKTSYISDENGSRVEGAHLPVAPAPEPIPEYIARALEWAAAHPYNEEAELKKTYN